MVKVYSNLIAILWLVRWPNHLIIILTQVLIRYCIIKPVLGSAYMEPQLPAGLFCLLVLATLLIAAGGYAINDYFDRKIDRINRPDSMIVGKTIDPRHAMMLHSIFTITGVLIGIYLSIKAGQVYLSLLFFMISGLLWFYSTTYKREFLMGNIIVSLLTALVPFVVLLFELPLLAGYYGFSVNPVTRILMIWVLAFSGFAFLINFLREVIKDAEDFEGDEAYGKKTIPVVWGMPAVRYITLAIALVIISLLIYAWFRYLHDFYTLIYFGAMIVIPLLFISYKILAGTGKHNFHQISTWTKVVMITGTGYMILANIIMRQL